MKNRRARARGFTLVNLLITIAVMAIVAAVVVPSAAVGGQLGVSSASVILISDLEYAQSLALASPDDPVVVRFDPEHNRYWIALLSDPGAPLVRPGTNDAPYVVEFGVGDSRASSEVVMTLQDIPDSMITFDRFGRLTSGVDAKILLEGSGPARTIEVDAHTGFVRVL